MRASIVILALAVSMMPAASDGQVVVSITVAPPVLPVYVQPVIPGDGYLWTPGYWAYGPEGYFWVPGVWVRPPQVGLLWTPGYWGWRGGLYAWNAGYWGPHVGFYGGVNYGFGFGGVGFVGGRWEGGHFAYIASCPRNSERFVLTREAKARAIDTVLITMLRVDSARMMKCFAYKAEADIYTGRPLPLHGLPMDYGQPAARPTAAGSAIAASTLLHA